MSRISSSNKTKSCKQYFSRSSSESDFNNKIVSGREADLNSSLSRTCANLLLKEINESTFWAITNSCWEANIVQAKIKAHNQRLQATESKIRKKAEHWPILTAYPVALAKLPKYLWKPARRRRPP